MRNLLHRAHATSAAAGKGLEHHRGAIAQPFQERLGLFDADRAVDPGHQRHLQALGQGTRGSLVAEQVEHFRLRPDEVDARALAAPGEFAVLSEETVARMDRLAALLQGQRDQPIHVEIGRHATAGQR